MSCSQVAAPGKQALDRNVFIKCVPMDPCTTTDHAITALLWSRIEQVWEVGERYAQSTTIHQLEPRHRIIKTQTLGQSAHSMPLNVSCAQAHLFNYGPHLR